MTTATTQNPAQVHGQIQHLELKDLLEHPEAHLVPEMRAEEWAELLADVRERGVQEPLHVLRPDGPVSGPDRLPYLVLDGRHRLRAARESDGKVTYVPVREVELYDESPLVYMIRAALRRRHLSDDQRAMLARRHHKILSEAAVRERGRKPQEKMSDTVSDNSEPASPAAPPKTEGYAWKVVGQVEVDEMPGCDFSVWTMPGSTGYETAFRDHPAAYRVAGNKKQYCEKHLPGGVRKVELLVLRTATPEPAAPEPPRPSEQMAELLSETAADRPKRDTRAEVAKTHGIPERKLRYAQEVETKAPELAPKVEAGEVTLQEARREIRKREKRDRLDQMEAAAAEARATQELLGDFLLGDSYTVLREGRRPGYGVFDLVLTDPPYGSSKSTVAHEDRADIVSDHGGWDEWCSSWVDLVASVLDQTTGQVLSFCPGERIGEMKAALVDAGLVYRDHLSWHRTNPAPKHRPGYISSWEAVVWATVPGSGYHFTPFENQGSPEAHNFIEGPTCCGGERLDHPTQKPLWLIEQLLRRHAAPGHRVLDPFAGVGTTMVACERYGCRYLGIELDAHFYRQGLARLTRCGVEVPAELGEAVDVHQVEEAPAPPTVDELRQMPAEQRDAVLAAAAETVADRYPFVEDSAEDEPPKQTDDSASSGDRSPEASGPSAAADPSSATSARSLDGGTPGPSPAEPEPAAEPPGAATARRLTEMLAGLRNGLRMIQVLGNATASLVCRNNLPEHQARDVVHADWDGHLVGPGLVEFVDGTWRPVVGARADYYCSEADLTYILTVTESGLDIQMSPGFKRFGFEGRGYDPDDPRGRAEGLVDLASSPELLAPYLDLVRRLLTAGPMNAGELGQAIDREQKCGYAYARDHVLPALVRLGHIRKPSQRKPYELVRTEADEVIDRQQERVARACGVDEESLAQHVGRGWAILGFVLNKLAELFREAPEIAAGELGSKLGNLVPNTLTFKVIQFYVLAGVLERPSPKRPYRLTTDAPKRIAELRRQGEAERKTRDLEEKQRRDDQKKLERKTARELIAGGVTRKADFIREFCTRARHTQAEYKESWGLARLLEEHGLELDPDRRGHIRLRASKS